MRLEEKRFYWYDSQIVVGRDLTRAFIDKILDGEAKLSGLPDLLEYFEIVYEYMSVYPQLEFKELDDNKTLQVDPVWTEPRDLKKTFSRVMKLHCRVQQEKVTQKRGPDGNVRVVPMQVWLAMPTLLQADYYPTVGDEFEFRGIPHVLTLVTVDPEDYFQLSAVPVYVRCECEVKQLSGMPVAFVGGAREEPGKPSSYDPSQRNVRDPSTGSPVNFIMSQ